jgi:polyisoprenoid-binding protein YceI
MRHFPPALGFIILAAITSAYAVPVTFAVTGGEGNLIRFESKAPLETVVGKTDRVSGIVSFDPEDLSAGVSARVEVDAASLKTGNKIRDGHMRNNYLETDQFPVISFVMDSAPLSGALPENGTYRGDVEGDFTCHGVTRKITVPVTVTRSGDEILMEGNFEVKLSDYDIKRPKFLIMKLDEVQRITVKIRGVVQ